MVPVKFWLASNSPRRREMLSWAGWRLEIVASHTNEDVMQNESPQDYVLRIAKSKCSDIDVAAQDDDMVIAADTIVVKDNCILGKPTDEQDAYRILLLLRGKTHQVMTALAIKRFGENTPRVDICCSDVCMREYSDEELWTYIKSGDPLDKAGAYAIQHAVFKPVVNFNGCFASVMGMPLCHLERNLRHLPNYLPTDWSRICQENLEYNCPITGRVMAGENIG